MRGFNTIALVTVSVAAVGSVAAYALVGGATSCARPGGGAGAGARLCGSRRGVGVADGVGLDHPRLDDG